jgi:ABC-type transporter Mla subunit MlaD
MSLLAQDERLTRRVGAVTLVVLAIAIVFFVFVHDRIDWGSHIRINVYFHTTGGLREGSKLVVLGHEVGIVESISLVPRGTKPILGDEDGVVVRVAIDSDAAAQINHGGDVFVTSRGALSSKYLEIGPAPQPGSSPHAPSERRPLRDGDEILGRDPPSLDRVLQRTWDNLQTTSAFADAVRPEMRALTAELDTLRATLAQIAPDVMLGDDVAALVDEGRRTYAALGGETGIAATRAMLDHADATVGQARATIAKLRASAQQLGDGLRVLRVRAGTRGAEAIDKVELAIARIRSAMDRVDPLLAQVELLQQQIARGDGSLLKLIHDPEFPEDAKELGKIMKRQPWKIIARPPK